MDKKKQDLYKRVFSGSDGQKVLKDLMDFCHFAQPVHDPSNPMNTAFNDGKRRVVLRVISFLKPDEAIKVHQNPMNEINFDEDL